ncbi:MAG: excinuclease ABC subunit UvrC [Gemmatimonadales bacterium]|nr:excinuclease ABC subunit UvrC [Gemmatimonadales bacterium]
MQTIPPALEPKIDALPDKPGVYLWKDANGAVLYVGKAKRLRQRVRNYFTADYSDSPKDRRLLRLIDDLDTIVVPSESQALLLENNLIKEYRPRFNIKLRDDKSYPRIAVTLGEPFPRVLVVRRLNLPGARYFGPYTDVAVLRRTLRIIRRIFTVRSCHYDLPDDTPDRACLDYHIHRCLAPCVRYQSQEDYRRMIDDVVAFLEGKTVEVRARLRERMEGASQQLDYERAAEIRDSLTWLEQLEQPQTIEFVGGGHADAIGYARDGDDAVGAILRVRRGRVVAREHRFFENLSETSDEEILSAFLVRHYVPGEARARRAVLPFVPADFDALTALAPDTAWSVPQRGISQRLVALADQNARHLMESFKIESFETDERAEDPVYALGRDLGLTVVPRSFVCIDISTNVGRDTVGSLVWFEGGRPKKSEYRRFKIRGEEGEKGQKGQERLQDDYAAVHEVVTRFLTRRQEEHKALPDLVVIDGGKGQLSAARRATEGAGFPDLPVASLAKREEEIFLPGRKQSLKLPARAPSLKLLQRARDEAHRFAVSYSRKQRAKRTVTSGLLTVPGVGEKRRRRLLEQFGSLAGVRSATPEEIAALPGFSLKLADRILTSVKK